MKTIWLFWAVVLLLGCKERVLTDPDFESYAKTACERQIKKDLHDPDSAQFPEKDEYQVKTLKPRTSFNVVVKVRSKNAFNAVRLNEFQCFVTDMEITADGGVKWRANVRQIGS